MGIPFHPRAPGGTAREHDSGRGDETGAFHRALLVAACGAYTVLAGNGLGRILLFGDEHHSARELDRPLGELASRYDAFGSGLLLPVLQKLSQGVLGPGHLADRALVFLAGLAAILLAFAVARRLLGATPAALTVLALGTSACFLFYGRYGRAYALAACACLAFVYGLVRLAEARERTEPWKRWAVLAVVAGALLPYAHLFAAGAAAAVGLAFLAASFVPRGADERLAVPARRVLVPVLGGAALLTITLHLPAWASLMDFLERKAFSGAPSEFDALDVATLSFGNRAGAWLALVCVPLAIVLLARTRSRTALLLGAVSLGPALVLLVASPPGLVYAYARYLVPSLPFQWMLVAWLVTSACRRLPRRGEAVALALGTTGLVALFLASPRGLARARGGPFANSNLALMPLPAFDVPWTRASRFYRVLAETPAPVTVIEAPELWNRSGLYLRNLWLAHGKDVQLGYAWQQDARTIPAGPYVDLWDPAAIEASGADYLVLHKNVYQELLNYWAFVHNEVWPEQASERLRPFMEAHSDFGFKEDRLARVVALERDLRRRLGPPAFEDHLVSVWELGGR